MIPYREPKTPLPDWVGCDAQSLKAEAIAVRFQGLSALTDVSLTLERHEVLGLIGPNGAGKTTLVNVLTGFQAPTEGRVLLGDADTAGWAPERVRREGIARTFQAGRLFKAMSVLENVETTVVGLGLRLGAARDHAEAVIDWVGLGDRLHVHAGALPYTDQRRLGIARALVLSPAFVLLDEPAAGMSDAECEHLMELIAVIPRTFTCGVLLIEHNMSVVMGISDRVHVLDGGATLASGTPAEIQTDQNVQAAYLGMEP